MKEFKKTWKDIQHDRKRAEGFKGWCWRNQDNIIMFVTCVITGLILGLAFVAGLPTNGGF